MNQSSEYLVLRGSTAVYMVERWLLTKCRSGADNSAANTAAIVQIVFDGLAVVPTLMTLQRADTYSTP